MAEICLDRQSEGFHSPEEEMDHREIAVRVPMMNEMQFLFPSEPCKSLKPRSRHVVFLVEKDVRIKRCGASDYYRHKKTERQQEINASADEKQRDKEKRCVVALVTEVGS